jgi:hypothetical protein
MELAEALSVNSLFARCSSEPKVRVSEMDWVPEWTPTTMALGLV